MASALIEELKTVAAEAKRSQIDDAVGSSWAALAVEEDPQGRGRAVQRLGGKQGCNNFVPSWEETARK